VAQEVHIPEESKELQPGFRRIIPEVNADKKRVDKRIRTVISFMRRTVEMFLL
jgi:hypothetical protein